MCVSKAKQGVGGRRERWPAAKGKREQPTRWPAGKESDWKLWPMRFFPLSPPSPTYAARSTGPCGHRRRLRRRRRQAQFALMLCFSPSFSLPLFRRNHPSFPSLPLFSALLFFSLLGHRSRGQRNSCDSRNAPTTSTRRFKG